MMWKDLKAATDSNIYEHRLGDRRSRIHPEHGAGYQAATRSTWLLFLLTNAVWPVIKSKWFSGCQDMESCTACDEKIIKNHMNPNKMPPSE